jgi:chromosome segregation ATPase
MTQAMIDKIKEHMTNLDKQIFKDNLLVAEENHKQAHLVVKIEELKKQRDDLYKLMDDMGNLAIKHRNVSSRKKEQEKRTEELEKEVESLKEENENIYSQMMSVEF